MLGSVQGQSLGLAILFQVTLTKSIYIIKNTKSNQTRTNPLRFLGKKKMLQSGENYTKKMSWLHNAGASEARPQIPVAMSSRLWK